MSELLLTSDKSRCEAKQKIIVSKDEGTSRKHRAINTDQKYFVRHYKLDGDIISQQKCCDFLLLNDTIKNAYFIELKGGNIDEAVSQLRRAAELLQKELENYHFYYRIVCSKVRTHDVQKNSFRKFKDECGGRLQYKSDLLEEVL